MKRRINILLSLLGIVCLLVAVYLLVQPYIANYFYNKEASDKVEQYDAKQHQSTESTKQQNASALQKLMNH